MSGALLLAAGTAAVAAMSFTSAPSRPATGRSVQQTAPFAAASAGSTAGHHRGRTLPGGRPLHVALLAVVIALAVVGCGPLAAGALVVAAATTRATLQRAGRQRRRDLARSEAVRALRAFRADLDSGRDPAAAAAEAFPRVRRDPRSGMALEAALALSRETGAPLAALVGRLAATGARAVETGLEREAALAGPRATGRLLAGLPVLGVALGSLGGAGTVGFLVAPGPGRVVLLGGVVLDALGVLWLDRLAADPTADSTVLTDVYADADADLSAQRGRR